MAMRKACGSYARKVTLWCTLLLVGGCLWPLASHPAFASPVIPPDYLLSLPPVTDAAIAESAPLAACGGEPYIALGYDLYNNSQGRVRSLVKFDLSRVPESAAVSHASLKLYYVNFAGSQAGKSTVSATRVSSPWAENSVQWASAPAIEPEPFGSAEINHSNKDTWVALDVTELVQAWVQGKYPNFGFALLGPEAAISPTLLFFESGDHYNPKITNSGLHPPSLEVTYQFLPAATMADEPPRYPTFLPLLLNNYPPQLDLHPIDNDNGEESYVISWTPHLKGALFYELYEWIGSAWQKIYTAAPNVTTYPVSHKPLGTYSYYLKATGAWGTEFSLVRSVTVSDRPGEFAYLVIGVGDYQKMDPVYTLDARLGNDLQYPIYDAADIQDMLEVYGAKEGQPSEQVLKLTDRRATKAGIQNAITGWLDAHEASNTIVFIYFAGHTLVVNQKPYLAPYDLECAPCAAASINSTWLAASAISVEEINTWLGDLASTQLIFVFDTPGSERWITALQGTNHTILAGSNLADERWEFRDVQNGAFSYYLSQAYLNGAAGNVSIDDVLAYTQASPSLAKFVYDHTLDLQEPAKQYAVLQAGAYSQAGFMSAVSVQACSVLGVK